MKFARLYVAVVASGCCALWLICIFDVFFRSMVCSDTKCRLNSPRKIILLTYMRSGSSFIGDILSAHPDVFYVFEPLHFVNHHAKTRFTFLGGSTIRLSQGEKGPLLTQVVSGLLNCSFEHVDKGTLTRRFIMKNSRSTLLYYQCLKEHQRTRGFIYCLPSLYRGCNQARVIVTKTIRLPMNLAEMMIEQDPDVRVIYLVRDPRATILSQRKLLSRKYKDFKSHTDIFCRRLITDLKSFTKIKVRYPNNVRIVLYENLADHPIMVSQTLYNFMKLRLSSGISEYITNLTMSGVEKSSCPMCIYKANSSRTAQEWRRKLSFNKAKYIDTMCGDAYPSLGYRFASTQKEYRNISFLLHTWPRI